MRKWSDRRWAGFCALLTIIGLAYVVFGLAFVPRAHGGIVNNSGSLGADSIAVPLWTIDSTKEANRVAFDTTADWGYIEVFFPGGDTAATDSFRIIGANTNKIVIRPAKYGGFPQVCYRRAIADIDGDGTPGTYTYTVTVRDSSLKIWTVCRNGEFTLYETADVFAKWDSTTGINMAMVANPSTAVDLSATTIRSTDSALIVNIKASDTVNANLIQISGDATSLSDFKDFVDDGYSPLTNAITAVGPNGVNSSTIADGAIDAATFAAGAIDAAAIATGAVDDDAVADGAIDWGGELDTTGSGAAAFDPSLDSVIVDVSAAAAGDGLATKIGDSNWVVAARTLTAIDEDATTLDLNATTIGTATNVTYAQYGSLDYSIRIGNALHYLASGQANPILRANNLVPNPSFELSVGSGTGHLDAVTNFGDNDLVGSVNLSDGQVNDTLGYWDCDSCGGSGVLQFSQSSGAHFGRQGLRVNPASHKARLNVSSSFFPLDSGVTYMMGIWASWDGTDVPDTCYLGLTDTTNTLSNGPAFKKLMLTPYVRATYGHYGFRLYQTRYTHTARSQPGRVVIYGRYTDTGTPHHVFDDVFVIPVLDSAGIDALTIAAGDTLPVNVVQVEGNTATMFAFDSTMRDVIGDTFNVVAGGITTAGDTLASLMTAIDAIRDSMDEAAATGASSVSPFDYQMVRFKGVFTRPWVSGFTASALTQGDDYWNDNQVVVLTGNAAGQVAGILDFVAATDSADIRPDFSTAPAAGDSFAILPILAPALVSDVSAGTGSQVDSFLVLDTSGADAPVYPATVTIYADGWTGNAFVAHTSGAGWAVFNLAPSTAYDAIVTAAGFTGTTYNITTGSGATFLDTLPVYDNAIGSPSAANLKRVYVDFELGGGDTLACVGAELYAELITPDSGFVPYDTSTNKAIGKPLQLVARASTSCRATIDLIPNNYIRPGGTKWKFTAKRRGQVLWTKTVSLSGTTTADLMDL